jgi:hypothetical protein
MPADIREYLMERFHSDAETLRQRAAALQSAAKPATGPDAALSLAMAQACDEVAALAELLPQSAALPEMLVALNAMLPALNSRAGDPALARTPAVRAVYAGAVTRIQEVIGAEARAAAADALGYDDDALIADDEEDSQ